VEVVPRFLATPPVGLYEQDIFSKIFFWVLALLKDMERSSKRVKITLWGTEELAAPTGSLPFLEVGPGASVGTLQTGYPHIQAQDKRQGGVRVPTCPKALAPASRLGAAPGPPRVPAAPAPASRLGAAPGPSRVPVALAPAS
jgi:hypothetical protein